MPLPWTRRRTKSLPFKYSKLVNQSIVRFSHYYNLCILTCGYP